MQAPPHPPPRGGAEGSLCKASLPMAGGWEEKDSRPRTQGRLLQACQGRAALPTAAIASLPALCSLRPDSWKACKGLRHCQKSLTFIKHLLRAQTFEKSIRPWQVLEM